MSLTGPKAIAHSPSGRRVGSPAGGSFMTSDDEMAVMEEGSVTQGPAQIMMHRVRMVDEETGEAKSTTVAEMCFVPVTEKPLSPKELMNIVRNKWKVSSTP